MLDASRQIAVIVRLSQPCEDFFSSLSYLNVPDGYEVEVVAVEDKGSIAAVYNAAMKQTRARYKIYMDEESRILDPDFFRKMLDVFAADEKIAVLGGSGTREFLSNGLYQTACKRVGRVCLGRRFEQREWEEVGTPYTEVVAVDEFFLATQYDLEWREDLFSGSCFYGTAQCLEFRRLGYKCVVPAQENAWIAYLREQYTFEKTAQTLFLQEYSCDILPLVSIVMPTYNRPGYFREALESVLAQTYQNWELFVTDDSPGEETKRVIEPYLARDKRIIYEHHPEYTGPRAVIMNWARAQSYNNPRAEYVNYLMDDDLFMPDKLARMVDVYLSEPGVTLVTSARQIIDKDGKVPPLEEWPITPAFEETVRLSGHRAGRNVLLFGGKNYIGENTTVLIRKKNLRNNALGWSGKEGNCLISDWPTWLHLLTQGDMVYIAEPLSCFRCHDGNDQKNLATKIAACACTYMEFFYAWETKHFFESRREYLLALSGLFVLISEDMQEFGKEIVDWLAEHLDNNDLLRECFGTLCRMHARAMQELLEGADCLREISES